MPIREIYTDKAGHQYTLWIDINDVINALIPTSCPKNREDRQKRGMMYRGHVDAEWSLLPTLFRPPAQEEITKSRRQYTQEFMDALVKNAEQLRLKNLSDKKLLAIAQHYGFYTELLDFSRNIEVAAYFATHIEDPPRIGAIFGYPIREYNELRKPSGALGASLKNSEGVMRAEILPPLLNENLDDVPRIYHQEGLFIECPDNGVKTVEENCIDRYYFYQRPGLTYQGQFAFESGLPGPNLFVTNDAYVEFMEIARREHPELFQQTPAFSRRDLFPPIDPLSVFAVEWKKAHPDPTIEAPVQTKRFPFFDALVCKALDSTPARAPAPKATTSPFGTAVTDYYFDRERRTPYQVSVLRRGRELIESLCKYKELDNSNNQRWLLWELLWLVTNGKYRCTVKLNHKTSADEEDTAFHLSIIDRWLVGTYSLDVPVAEAQLGFWQVRFDRTHYTKRDKKPEIHAAQKVFSLQEQYRPKKGNPYRAKPEIRKILSSVKKELRNCKPGEESSFVYDLQCILMKSFGRDLLVVLGQGQSNNCCFYSPHVQEDCENEKPQLIIEIYDSFFHALKRTSVCSKHRKQLSEGDFDLFDTSIEIPIGLA